MTVMSPDPLAGDPPAGLALRSLAEIILRRASGSDVVAVVFAEEFASDVLAPTRQDRRVLSSEDVERWMDGIARRVVDVDA